MSVPFTFHMVTKVRENDKRNDQSSDQSSKRRPDGAKWHRGAADSRQDNYWASVWTMSSSEQLQSYSNKMMKAIWGLYNRYSVHNFKSNQSSDAVLHAAPIAANNGAAEAIAAQSQTVTGAGLFG